MKKYFGFFSFEIRFYIWIFGTLFFISEILFSKNIFEFYFSKTCFLKYNFCILELLFHNGILIFQFYYRIPFFITHKSILSLFCQDVFFGF